jgi:hypothetical protein
MSDEIPKKEELATRVEKESRNIFELFDSIADPERPRTVGDWSVRDLMAHVLSWHDECLWAFKSTLDGTYERRDFSDFDKVNAELLPRYDGQTARELRVRLETTAAEIADQIRKIPEDLWQSKRRLSAWVETTVVGHYAEHAEDLEKVEKGDQGG